MVANVQRVEYVAAALSYLQKTSVNFFPTTKYPYGFQNHLFHLFFTIFLQLSTMIISFTDVINRFSNSRLTKISAAMF